MREDCTGAVATSGVSRREAMRWMMCAGAGLCWAGWARPARGGEPAAGNNRAAEVWIRPQRSDGQWRELGMNPKGIAALLTAFRGQLEQNRHPGAELAVYRNGRMVLEMGGGIARKSPLRPVSPETLFVLFSCTKPWSATAALILIERGKLRLDAKVAEYWPQFASHGKQDVTVYHALSHRGGYPMFPLDLSDRVGNDPRVPARALEETRLSWKPGEANGYHGINFGEALAELVRRVDGRDMGTFLRQEMFEKIKMTESYMGLPADRPELDDRVAYLYEMEQNTPGSAFRFGHDMNPAIPEWKFVWNRPEVHQMMLPSGGGITTAGDYARFFGMLANGGEIGGVRLLKKQTIDQAIERTNAPGEIDRSFRVAMPWGLGFMLGGNPRLPFFGASAGQKVFGHLGAGCNVGWADPELRLGFAYLTNGNLKFHNSLERVGELGESARKACL